jgi:hypothetical protein
MKRLFIKGSVTERLPNSSAAAVPEQEGARRELGPDVVPIGECGVHSCDFGTFVEVT